MRVQVPCGCGARKRSRFHLVTAISLILLAGTWCWIRSLRISCEDSRGTTTGRTPRTGSVFMAHCTNRTKRLIPAKKTAIEEAQSKRKSALKRLCAARQLSLNALTSKERHLLLRNIIVSDERKLLYCCIPHVACPTWNDILKKHSNESKLKVLVSYSPDQIERRLRTYYSFTFVRHPLARLVAAYRKNFVNGTKSALAKEIIKRYRNDPKAEKSGVTFEEFVRFLLEASVWAMDRHWQPSYLICQPCIVSYNFIGSFESLEDESNYVLERRGARERWPTGMRFNDTAMKQDLENMYKGLSSDLVRELVGKYHLDFSLFGYDFGQYL
ncbi:carbohydrate sulfotransferase 14-like isoform X3 [Oscarella lobularis]|uniref:carbohydrate sulfotransferase 14-like isoform X3 n=1 Tax=Oscarella lobularis TaxID=121494 RepID=UPI0033144D77